MLKVPKTKASTRNQSETTKKWLENVQALKQRKIEKICKEMTFQKKQKYQLRTQIDFSITFNLGEEVCGVGTESVNPKANGGLLYLYTRGKNGSTKNAEEVCRNVPVQLGNSNEARLKLSRPTTNAL